MHTLSYFSLLWICCATCRATFCRPAATESVQWIRNESVRIAEFEHAAAVHCDNITTVGPCRVYGRRLRDVLYSSFDVQKDDSYTGRGRVERRRRDFVCGAACKAVEPNTCQNFNTDWSGENATFTLRVNLLAWSVNCMRPNVDVYQHRVKGLPFFIWEAILIHDLLFLPICTIESGVS